MHFWQLLITRWKEKTATALHREPAKQALALDRDTGNAADADDVDGDACFLHRRQRLLERRRALFVISVGDEDDGPASLRIRKAATHLRERIEDGRHRPTAEWL